MSSMLSTTPSNTRTPGAYPTRARAAIALTAFLAILSRDIIVTWRNLIQFLVQVLVQPIFLLFVFGKVLSVIGSTQSSFASLLFPGVVALTIFLNGIQGVTLSLVLDLGYSREIDDRLLAPLPVSLVAVEKVLFATIQGLVAGALMFPLAYWILGDTFAVRTDALGPLLGIMLLTALSSATLGLMLGTLVRPEQIGFILTLIFTPLIFTGSVYYPWATLTTLRWFQIVSLFNPLTYASEGLRYAMVPTIHGHALPTLGPGWTIAGLSIACIIFFTIGVRSFYKRVVS